MNLTQIPIPGTNYSPNRFGVGVDTVIYHWIDGTQSVADLLFQRYARQVSAHFSVEEDSVHQYVKLQHTAYQAGNWEMNKRSVGIEHSAQPGRDASSLTYETSAQLVFQIAKQLGRKVGDLRHLPHSAVVATACPGTIDIDRIVRRAMDLEAFASLPDAPAVLASAPATPATIVVPTTFWVRITASQLRVRTAPNSASADVPDKLLAQGDEVECSEATFGNAPYGDGRNVWLRTKRSGLFIWAGGTDYHHQTTNA